MSAEVSHSIQKYLLAEIRTLLLNHVYIVIYISLLERYDDSQYPKDALTCSSLDPQIGSCSSEDLAGIFQLNTCRRCNCLDSVCF